MNHTIQSYEEYRELTPDQKELWQFERLSCISDIKKDVSALKKKVDYIYIWSSGVAAGATFIFYFIKEKLFK